MHPMSFGWNALAGRGAAGCLAVPALAGAAMAAMTAMAAEAPRIPVQAKQQAIRSADPSLSVEAVAARLARLEAAWSWAEAKGLLKTPAWQEDRQEGRRAILGKAYLEARPGHPAMTEDQVLAAYLAQGEQRRVSHVLCKAQEEAEAALKRLQGGEPFETVAADVSKDPSAATNQGSLGWIRQRELVAAFGEPVFAASIGALVGPFKSEFGWHVAKVWEARRPKAEDFPAARPALMKQAADAQTAMKRDAALETLRTRHPLVPDLGVLGSDRTTEALPGDEKRVAGRVAGARISLKALKAHLQVVLKTMGQSHSLGAATKARFMEGLADEIRLAAAAQKQGLDRRPDIQAALWRDEREKAMARFSGNFLASVPVPDPDLRRHQEAFPERFRPIGALRLQVLVAESKDRVDEALNQVRAGMAWRAAAERFGSAEATGDPDPGWVEVSALRNLVPPSLMQALLSGSLGQPVGPMLGPDGFMLFNVLERRPGPVPPLDECREAVRVDYLKANGRALVDRELDARAAAGVARGPKK
ncbi:MAG: peptidyl-prolyl cis-trans isomerase [Geothrix sp.]|nr:peptidyl-prolyl cis-trans isomerase [Geothrix sp.]